MTQDGGWNAISEDGQRMITVEGFGYAIYSVEGEIDPKAETRTFIHRGLVGDFALAEQWLKDGNVMGRVVQIYVTPKAPVRKGQTEPPATQPRKPI